uniref:Uncharacterized protein n=1 Tax=Anguilla anguilla TaxID=7936 RepID=A0A0E9WU13_ANGAN
MVILPDLLSVPGQLSCLWFNSVVRNIQPRVGSPLFKICHCKLFLKPAPIPICMVKLPIYSLSVNNISARSLSIHYYEVT